MLCLLSRSLIKHCGIKFSPHTLPCYMILCQSWRFFSPDHVIKLLDSSVEVHLNPALLIIPNPWYITSSTFPLICLSSQHLLLATWPLLEGRLSNAWIGSLSLAKHQKLIAEHPSPLLREVISSPNSFYWISRLLLVLFLSLSEIGTLVSLSAQRKKWRERREYLRRVDLVLDSPVWNLMLFFIFGSHYRWHLGRKKD